MNGQAVKTGRQFALGIKRAGLMNRGPSGKTWIIVAGSALALVVAAGVFLARRNHPPSGGSTAENEAPAGFRELARESGIQFRMRFLPGEQGENFKINLYDHGCGVAV